MSGASSQSSNKHVFISHASADDDFVRELRVKLELSGVKLWVDSRNLAGGNKLQPEVEQAILASSHIIAVLSPCTINSKWVRKEIQFAEVNNHEVIPLMLPGIESGALGAWFDEEPVGIPVEFGEGKLDEVMAAILVALGQRLPDDPVSDTEVEQQPVAELLLKLSRPGLVKQEDGSEQLSAEAEVEFIPVDGTNMRTVSSEPFLFTAPIGQGEQKELRWYLEQYIHWPVGPFCKRAEELEVLLPQWGDALFAELWGKEECRTVLEAWQAVRSGVERRFSLHMDTRLLKSASDETRAKANEAASRLQALPWELLRHDGAYLCASANPVHIRRRLPNLKVYEASLLQLPIRILLVTARPEQDGVSYIDHRASALPLVDAVEALGDLVQLTVLTPATLPALAQVLKHAHDIGQPYHVLHFDGHGVYDPKYSLGALCFEDANDSSKLLGRRMELVYADKLAELLRGYRVPLVFLEACQTAQTENDPNASVAARLLEEGIASVVAMTHSVLVKTAERFVTEFYQALAAGKRVGAAMLAGQENLRLKSYRLAIPGAGDLHLQDWFVPILYQEQNDPVLFKCLPSVRAKRMVAQQRQAVLGELPATPEHTFIGRSRELLKLERLLEREPYAVVRGQGGIGKTTIAVELARWLVRSRRFDRCAFVCMEDYSHDRAVLDVLGKQLAGDFYSVAEYGDDLDKALQPLLRALEDFRCLIVVDNLESLLGDEVSDNLTGVFDLLQKLLTPSPQPLSRTERGAKDKGAFLLFTTREPLPAPFNHETREIILGALSHIDAKALVLQVMNSQGLDLRHDDLGNDPEEVNALVDAVGGHARALVLLARELAVKGVTATTENVREVMVELERRYPGERELSLFASVELSLRRLSPGVREQIDGLAVLGNGGHLVTFSHVLGIGDDKFALVMKQVIDVGLAQATGNYGYILIDPALSPYLALDLQDSQYKNYQQLWLEATESFLAYLYKLQFERPDVAVELIKSGLFDVMRYLSIKKASSAINAEKTIEVISCLESLLEFLGKPCELQQVAQFRDEVSSQIKMWNHAKFCHFHRQIEQLMSMSKFQEMTVAARHLLQRCQSVGGNAYFEAEYDLGMAYLLVGKALARSSPSDECLIFLGESIQIFERVGDDGKRMRVVAISESGYCLLAMGRFRAAYEKLVKAIQLGEKIENHRQTAYDKKQLATVLIHVGQCEDALSLLGESLKVFEQLNEPYETANVFHRMGIAHRMLENFEEAEFFYRKALPILSKQNLSEDEAGCLCELGTLYRAVENFGQSLSFYEQSAILYRKLNNALHESFVRDNIASMLIMLERYSEARNELNIADLCKKGLGNRTKPWVTWGMFAQLEIVDGNYAEAHRQRKKALDSYLIFRRNGGENRDGLGNLISAVQQSLHEGDTKKAEQLVEHSISNQVQGQEHQRFFDNLKAIIAGNREMILAEDKSLHYELAAELILLLEGFELLGKSQSHCDGDAP